MARFKLIAGGLCAYVTGVGAVVYYQGRKKRECAGPVGKQSEADRMRAFDDHAPCYDDEIGISETTMGIGLLRWWLIRKARGRTLEIGAGTGRNLSYYDDDKTSVTLTDYSLPMVQQMRAKLEKRPVAAVKSVVVADAKNLAQFGDASFDTVVDTFGLCSFEDVDAVLAEMQRVCKPSGQLLLLEHGRGSYAWLNEQIDAGADEHARKWGCYFNKDIDALVQRAGLRQLEISRFHFGTTYMITAKPGDAVSKAGRTVYGNDT